jgi:hypothetical protein
MVLSVQVKNKGESNMHKAFKKPKLKVLIVFISSFILLTTLLIIIACINAKPTESPSDEPQAHTTSQYLKEENLPVIKDPSIYDYLCLERNSSGYTLISVENYPDSILSIPPQAEDGMQITAIGDAAFSDCTTLLEINIPATVKRIGSACFVGASSLVAINVEPSNAYFASVGGVLFSYDKTELICYPAAKIGEKYLLSTNVKKIAPYAFYGVINLKAILYQGSAAKYQSIEIGIENQTFTSLPVTCNYKGAK